jgi:hypothetical protein|tara:strand:+ start:69 stop:710 length:642 start_codon:yes stop_codon:yes gene_type:complete
MSHYTIIELEDFMPPQHVDAIQDLLESPDINWVFCQTTLKPYGLTKDPVWFQSLPDCEMKEKVIDTHMCVHMHFDSQGPNKERPLIMREFDCINTILLLAQQKLKFEVVEITRVKTNLLQNLNGFTKENHNIPHIDLYNEHYEENFSLIYYVNDSDGDTKFFNKDFELIKRVSPKKGKVVIFHSNTLHTSSNPIESPYRMVVNFNVRLKGLNN